MIRVTLFDQSSLDITEAEARELLPFRNLFRSAELRDPFEGLILHQGEILPVLGPLPLPAEDSSSPQLRPWILVQNGQARVIRGFPEFEEPGNVVPLRPAGDSREGPMAASAGPPSFEAAG